MLNVPKKKKFNPLLMNVIIVSLGVHLVGLLILGGITVIKHVIPDEAQFEEPPAVAEEEPPPPVKVQIQPQASKQQAMNNLSMRPVADIAVANVAVDLPSMDQSFTVSSGLGGIGRVGGLLGGGGTGTIGMGMSDVSVFGLKARAERILFVIDTGRPMVYDSKGGLNSYRVIKKEIAEMVGRLSAGTLFNVLLFDDTTYAYTKLFKPKLVPAGAALAAELSEWFEPVNADIDSLGPGVGKKYAAVATKLKGYEAYFAGLNQFPTAQTVTQVAMEMGVDAIFQVVGDHQGFGRIRLGVTEEERQRIKEKKEWQENDSKWQAEYAAHKEEKASVKQRIDAQLAKENKRRASRGLPPKVMHPNIYRQAKEMGFSFTTPKRIYASEHQIANYAEGKQAERYFKALSKELFDKNGRPPPSMNVILFLAGDEEFAKDKKKAVSTFVRHFKGKMKIIRGLSGIQKSASAENISN